MFLFALDRLRTVAVVAALAVAAGCSQPSLQDLDATTSGAELYSGFTLGRLLADPIDHPRAADLPALLAARWQTVFAMVNEETPGRRMSPDRYMTVANCREYERAAARGMVVADPGQRDALVELAAMCRAAEALAAAEPPANSYLTELTFDRRLPTKLPADLAVLTTTADHARLARSSPDATWAELATIRSVEQLDEHHAIYHLPDGRQELRLVGKGDIDGDGLEDAILTSREIANDGRWQVMRVFTLSRFRAQSPYVIQSEFSPLY